MIFFGCGADEIEGPPPVVYRSGCGSCDGTGTIEPDTEYGETEPRDCDDCEGTGEQR